MYYCVKKLRILIIQSENAEKYKGLLMKDIKLNNRSGLINTKIHFDIKKNIF